jgi:hypothetical protein
VSPLAKFTPTLREFKAEDPPIPEKPSASLRTPKKRPNRTKLPEKLSAARAL